MQKSRDLVQKNELEMALDLAHKLLIDRALIDGGPKGVKFSTGQRMSYRSAANIIKRVRQRFALDGKFSLSVCKTCDNFNNRGYATGNSGKCKGREVWCYDTCEHHTPNEETWGI